MRFIPAISIRGGRVAMAEEGRYAYLRDGHGNYRDPVDVVKELDTAGDTVFVLDLNGLERNSPDLDTVKRMAAHRDIWLDAGVGDAGGMMDMFVSDASKVVMGTLCMTSLAELRRALELSGEVIFSIGYDGGIVSPEPTLKGRAPKELMEEIGRLETGLFFDLGGKRDERKPHADMIARLVPHFGELFFSGHVESGDIAALEDAGVSGIIADFRSLEAIRNG